MSKDIRLSLDFKTHRKRKKLQYKLGPEGVLSLIDFWMSVAEQRPSGILTGYDESDIEIEGDWKGEPGAFVAALLEFGFLVKEDSVFKVHNWTERQEWVCDSENRSDKARLSRIAKTNRPLHEALKKLGYDRITKNDYQKINDSLTTVNGPLNDITTVVNEVLEKPAVFLTPAPAPSPSPAPMALTNVTGDPVPLSKSESKHFREKTGKYFKKIKAACVRVEALGLYKFNPYQFVQQNVNNRGHPGAILHTLQKILDSKFKIPSPWGFANKIMRIENGNFNEADDIQYHEIFKRMDSGALSELTHGLIKGLE